ncbi:hypothetical protein [Haloarcula amylolytica]|uniref:hypothetical protein n=1 Tax=Haloarcula amylolytica TaxID=396317 RepID=UPI003C73C043
MIDKILNSRKSVVQALLAIFVVGSVISGGAAAHSLNQSLWDSQDELESISADNSSVNNGTIEIPEGSMYQTDNITTSEAVTSFTVNISNHTVNEVVVVVDDNNGSSGTSEVILESGTTTVPINGTVSDFSIDIDAPDDIDGTNDTVVVESIEANIATQDPVLVFNDTNDVHQIETNESHTIDVSNSFDYDGDNLTYEYAIDDGSLDWQTMDNGTLTINKSTIGETDYVFRAVDEHGATSDVQSRTVQVLESDSDSTETATESDESGGAVIIGDSGDGQSPIVVLGVAASIIAALIAILGIAKVAE